MEKHFHRWIFPFIPFAKHERYTYTRITKWDWIRRNAITSMMFLRRWLWLWSLLIVDDRTVGLHIYPFEINLYLYRLKRKSRNDFHKIRTAYGVMADQCFLAIRWQHFIHFNTILRCSYIVWFTIRVDLSHHMRWSEHSRLRTNSLREIDALSQQSRHIHNANDNKSRQEWAMEGGMCGTVSRNGHKSCSKTKSKQK